MLANSRQIQSIEMRRSQNLRCPFLSSEYYRRRTQWSIPVTFGNSNPSIIAEDTAIPEEGDFTDVPERLVK